VLSSTVALAAVRFGCYLAALLLVGATGLALRLSADLGESTIRLRVQAVRLALIAAVALTIGRVASLYGQTWLFFGMDEGVNAETLRIIAMDTAWGAGWRVQFAAATFALIGALLVRAHVYAGWPVLGVGALIAAGSQSLTGHAVEGGWLSPAVFAQAAHVLGAAIWIGSLLAIFTVVLRRDPDRALVATVIELFSPLALLGAGTLLLAGLASSYLYLSSPTDLLWTVYGRLLGAKVVGFGVIASLGYHNWQRIKPRLGDAAADDDLRRAVTAELAVAVMVLVFTAFLVVLPLPTAAM